MIFAMVEKTAWKQEMTRYEDGFMNKCAEHGLSTDVAYGF